VAIFKVSEKVIQRWYRCFRKCCCVQRF